MVLEQEFELTIDRIGYEGEGIGKHQGMTVFVNGALPGEVVRASLYERRTNFGRARLLSILKPSVDRVVPPCPLFGRCGGCQLMHASYPQQLLIKRQRVVDAFKGQEKVAPCEASPLSLHYRNKMQLPCGLGEGSENGASPMVMGLYAAHTHDIVDIQHCYVHSELGDRAYQKIREIVQSSGLTSYNYRTGKGDLRHLMMRTALATQQLLIVLITNGPGPSFLSVLAEQMRKEVPEIAGVVQSINLSQGNTIIGSECITLAGSSFIEERLLGVSFKVSATSFFQVNPMQAERVYTKVLELSGLFKADGGYTVIDLYCGVGTLSLIAAKHARHVIGVESVPEAIRDAKENALRNHVTNAEFVCSTAEQFMDKWEKDKAVDVVFLNPPRKGCASTVLDKMIQWLPPTIIYVSCDPETLARDVSLLRNKGYRVEGIYPFDMFPQTMHVESVVKLQFMKQSSR